MEVAEVVRGEASLAVVVHPKDGARAVAAEVVAGDRASAVRVNGEAAASSSKVDSTRVVTAMAVVTSRVETGVAREETHGTRTVASRAAGATRVAAGARAAVALATISATTTSRDTVPVRCALVAATRISDRHHTVWSRTTVTKEDLAQAAAATVMPVETVGTRRVTEYKLAERGWDARSIV